VSSGADKTQITLSSSVVVVTGSSGQLGTAYAQWLVKAGARVIGIDNQPARVRLDERSYLHAVADLRMRDQLEEVLDQCESMWGTPTGLINNAAIDAPPGSSGENVGLFEEYPIDVFRDVLDVNIIGSVVPCQVFGGAMARSGRGTIVNVSSIYGLVAPDQRIYEYQRQTGKTFFKPAAYAVSKSAILNLTRYLSTYWADRGVRVNTLIPAGVWNDQPSEFMDAYVPKVPLGRMARPSDFFGALEFLLTDKSAYVTGTNVVVDGGYTAW
jgi:NAD(P)-dependent dehydrogenase (short-subunit alcohol dehydrogenase family)